MEEANSGDLSILDRPILAFAERRHATSLWSPTPPPLRLPALAPPVAPSPRSVLLMTAVHLGIPIPGANPSSVRRIEGWMDLAAIPPAPALPPAPAPGAPSAPAPPPVSPSDIALRTLEPLRQAYVAAGREVGGLAPIVSCVADPSLSVLKKSLADLQPGSGRTVVHYVGGGVPALAGDLWAFDKDQLRYTRFGIAPLIAKTSTNVLLIVDAPGSGTLASEITRVSHMSFNNRTQGYTPMHSRDADAQPMPSCDQKVQIDAGTPVAFFSDDGTTVCTVVDSFYPSDILTSCISDPLRMAMLRSLRALAIGHSDAAYRARLQAVALDVLLKGPEVVFAAEGVAIGPGDQPALLLGEITAALNCTIDAVSWSLYTNRHYDALFNLDPRMRRAARGFVLATRVLAELGISTSASPPPPPPRALASSTAWDAFDSLLDAFWTAHGLGHIDLASPSISHLGDVATPLVDMGVLNALASAADMQAQNAKQLARPVESNGFDSSDEGVPPATHACTQNTSTGGSVPGIPAALLRTVAATRARMGVPAAGQPVSEPGLFALVVGWAQSNVDPEGAIQRLYSAAISEEAQTGEGRYGEILNRAREAARAFEMNNGSYFAFWNETVHQLELLGETPIGAASAASPVLPVVVGCIRPTPTLPSYRRNLVDMRRLRAAECLWNYVNAGGTGALVIAIRAGLVPVLMDAWAAPIIAPRMMHALIGLTAKLVAASPQAAVSELFAMPSTGPVSSRPAMRSPHGSPARPTTTLPPIFNHLVTVAFAHDTPPDRRSLALIILAACARHSVDCRKELIMRRTFEAAAAFTTVFQSTVRIYACLYIAEVLGAPVGALGPLVTIVLQAYDGNAANASRALRFRIPRILTLRASDPCPDVRAAATLAATAVLATPLAFDLQLHLHKLHAASAASVAPTAPPAPAPAATASPFAVGFNTSAAAAFASFAAAAVPHPPPPPAPVHSVPAPSIVAVTPLRALQPWIALTADPSAAVRRAALTLIATLQQTLPLQFAQAASSRVIIGRNLSGHTHAHTHSSDASNSTPTNPQMNQRSVTGRARASSGIVPSFGALVATGSAPTLAGVSSASTVTCREFALDALVPAGSQYCPLHNKHHNTMIAVISDCIEAVHRLATDVVLEISAPAVASSYALGQLGWLIVAARLPHHPELGVTFDDVSRLVAAIGNAVSIVAPQDANMGMTTNDDEEVVAASLSHSYLAAQPRRTSDPELSRHMDTPITCQRSITAGSGIRRPHSISNLLAVFDSPTIRDAPIQLPIPAARPTSAGSTPHSVSDTPDTLRRSSPTLEAIAGGGYPSHETRARYIYTRILLSARTVGVAAANTADNFMLGYVYTGIRAPLTTSTMMAAAALAAAGAAPRRRALIPAIHTENSIFCVQHGLVRIQSSSLRSVTVNDDGSTSVHRAHTFATGCPLCDAAANQAGLTVVDLAAAAATRSSLLRLTLTPEGFSSACDRCLNTNTSHTGIAAVIHDIAGRITEGTPTKIKAKTTLMTANAILRDYRAILALAARPSCSAFVPPRGAALPPAHLYDGVGTKHEPLRGHQLANLCTLFYPGCLTSAAIARAGLDGPGSGASRSTLSINSSSSSLFTTGRNTSLVDIRTSSTLPIETATGDASARLRALLEITVPVCDAVAPRVADPYSKRDWQQGAAAGQATAEEMGTLLPPPDAQNRFTLTADLLRANSVPFEVPWLETDEDDSTTPEGQGRGRRQKLPTPASFRAECSANHENDRQILPQYPAQLASLECGSRLQSLSQQLQGITLPFKVGFGNKIASFSLKSTLSTRPAPAAAAFPADSDAELELVAPFACLDNQPVSITDQSSGVLTVEDIAYTTAASLSKERKAIASLAAPAKPTKLLFHPRISAVAQSDTQGRLSLWDPQSGILRSCVDLLRLCDLTRDTNDASIAQLAADGRGKRDSRVPWFVQDMSYGNVYDASTVVLACSDGCVRVVSGCDGRGRLAVRGGWRLRGAAAGAGGAAPAGDPCGPADAIRSWSCETALGKLVTGGMENNVRASIQDACLIPTALRGGVSIARRARGTLNHDSGLYAAAFGSNIVDIYDLITEREAATVNLNPLLLQISPSLVNLAGADGVASAVTSLSMSSGKTGLTIAHTSGNIFGFDLRAPSRTPSYHITAEGSTNFKAGAISVNGNDSIWVSSAHSVSLYDVRAPSTPTVTLTRPGATRRVSNYPPMCSVHAALGFAVATASDGTVHSARLTSSSPRWECLTGVDKNPDEIAFHPSRIMMATSYDGMINVYSH